VRWVLVQYVMRVGGGWNIGVTITNSAFLASSWISWALNMGPIGCPKMWVRNYHSMLCNIPEERRCQLCILLLVTLTIRFSTTELTSWFIFFKVINWRRLRWTRHTMYGQERTFTQSISWWTSKYSKLLA